MLTSPYIAALLLHALRHAHTSRQTARLFKSSFVDDQECPENRQVRAIMYTDAKPITCTL